MSSELSNQLADTDRSASVELGANGVTRSSLRGEPSFDSDDQEASLLNVKANSMQVSAKPNGETSKLDPRHFTPNLHASLVSEILTLRRDSENKGKLILSLEEQLDDAEKEFEDLQSTAQTSAQESRDLRRRLQALETGHERAIEELSHEIDAALEVAGDAKKRSDTIKRRLKSRDEELERVNTLWQSDIKDWEIQKRNLDRKLHVAESRAKTFAKELEAIHVQNDTFRNVHPAEGDQQILKESLSGRIDGTNSALSHRLNETPSGIPEISVSPEGETEAQSIVPSLADELALGSDLDEFELGDDASVDALPEEHIVTAVPYISRSASGSLKARKILGLSITKSEGELITTERNQNTKSSNVLGQDVIKIRSEDVVSRCDSSNQTSSPMHADTPDIVLGTIDETPSIADDILEEPSADSGDVLGQATSKILKDEIPSGSIAVAKEPTPTKSQACQTSGEVFDTESICDVCQNSKKMGEIKSRTASTQTEGAPEDEAAKFRNTPEQIYSERENEPTDSVSYDTQSLLATASSSSLIQGEDARVNNFYTSSCVQTENMEFLDYDSYSTVKKVIVRPLHPSSPLVLKARKESNQSSRGIRKVADDHELDFGKVSRNLPMQVRDNNKGRPPTGKSSKRPEVVGSSQLSRGLEINGPSTPSSPTKKFLLYPPFPVPDRSSSKKITDDLGTFDSDLVTPSEASKVARRKAKGKMPHRSRSGSIGQSVRSHETLSAPETSNYPNYSLPIYASNLQSNEMTSQKAGSALAGNSEAESSREISTSDSRMRREQNGHENAKGVSSHGSSPSNSTSVVDAIAQTMIGEWLWKYVRRRTSFGLPESPAAEFELGKSSDSNGARHLRWVWLAPYERAVMWSSKQPTSGTALMGKSGRKLVIQSVLDVRDESPLPRNADGDVDVSFGRSILILTAQRAIKFTAKSRESHYVWLTALSFLSHSSVVSSSSLPSAIYAGHGGSLAPQLAGKSARGLARSNSIASIRTRAAQDTMDGQHADIGKRVGKTTLLSSNQGEASNNAERSSARRGQHTITMEKDDGPAEAPLVPRYSRSARRRSYTGNGIPQTRSFMGLAPSQSAFKKSSIQSFAYSDSGILSTGLMRVQATNDNANSKVPAFSASKFTNHPRKELSNIRQATGGAGSETALGSHPVRNSQGQATGNFFEAVGTIRMEAFVRGLD